MFMLNPRRILLAGCGAFAFGGCGADVEPVAPGPPRPAAPATTAAAVRERCAPYAATPLVVAWCVQGLAAGVDSRAELDALCPDAGEWETRCRQAWVEPRLHPGSGVTTDALRAACGADADCQLDVLDHRPEPLRAQLDACGTWAGDNVRHCVSHAIDRWRADRPTAEALAAVLADPGPAPAWVGHFAAEVVVCDGVGACAGSSEVAEACAARVEALTVDRSPCRRVGAPGARPAGRPGRAVGHPPPRPGR